MEFLNEYMLPVVLGICLCVGYVVKKWIKDVDNKYIPTIVFILGAVLNCIVMKDVTVETLVGGAICGLASTGLHQAFTRLIENKEN